MVTWLNVYAKRQSLRPPSKQSLMSFFNEEFCFSLPPFSLRLRWCLPPMCANSFNIHKRKPAGSTAHTHRPLSHTLSQLLMLQEMICRGSGLIRLCEVADDAENSLVIYYTVTSLQWIGSFQVIKILWCLYSFLSQTKGFLQSFGWPPSPTYWTTILYSDRRTSTTQDALLVDVAHLWSAWVTMALVCPCKVYRRFNHILTLPVNVKSAS